MDTIDIHKTVLVTASVLIALIGSHCAIIGSNDIFHNLLDISIMSMYTILRVEISKSFYTNVISHSLSKSCASQLMKEYLLYFHISDCVYDSNHIRNRYVTHVCKLYSTEYITLTMNQTNPLGPKFHLNMHDPLSLHKIFS
jgi:hypothetical protein